MSKMVKWLFHLFDINYLFKILSLMFFYNSSSLKVSNEYLDFVNTLQYTLKSTKFLKISEYKYVN